MEERGISMNATQGSPSIQNADSAMPARPHASVDRFSAPSHPRSKTAKVISGVIKRVSLEEKTLFASPGPTYGRCRHCNLRI
jgi:hypothetical protein